MSLKMEMAYRSSFIHSRLKRKRQEISQQRLSELAGISRTGLRHLESLEINPTLYTLLKVANALGFSVGSYLSEKDY
ncbi:MAG: helix-turn-helix transcriptional regulator [Verrucomicrobiota bacterium]